MKKFFSLITILSVFAIVAISCSDKKLQSNNNNGGSTAAVGKLKLNLSKDNADYVTVKSGVSTDNFKVSIKDEQGVQVYSWDKASEIDEIIGLKVGNYTVEATSGTMPVAAWDAAHYYGSQSFFVSPEMVTAVNLICYIDNAKITVQYTPEFKAFFGSDYEIALVNSENISAPLMFNSTESRSAFVKPIRTELRFNSTKAPSNITVLDPVRPKDHHIVTFGVKPVGDAMLNMTVDVTTNDINMDLEIPTDEEDLGNGGDMPDPNPNPDPTPEYKVEIVGDGFNIDNPLVISDAVDFDDEGNCNRTVRVNLNAEAKIKNLIVDINSPDLPEELLIAAIGAKRFDIANPTEEIRANLIMFQILKETDVVKGATSFVFDVTGFMGLLPVNVITHNFEITLTDENDKTVIKTLSISRTE